MFGLTSLPSFFGFHLTNKNVDLPETFDDGYDDENGNESNNNKIDVNCCLDRSVETTLLLTN